MMLVRSVETDYDNIETPSPFCIYPKTIRKMPQSWAREDQILLGSIHSMLVILFCSSVWVSVTFPHN